MINGRRSGQPPLPPNGRSESSDHGRSRPSTLFEGELFLEYWRLDALRVELRQQLLVTQAIDKDASEEIMNELLALDKLCARYSVAIAKQINDTLTGGAP